MRNAASLELNVVCHRDAKISTGNPGARPGYEPNRKANGQSDGDGGAALKGSRPHQSAAIFVRMTMTTLNPGEWRRLIDCAPNSAA
jgi:hypothetical protein